VDQLDRRGRFVDFLPAGTRPLEEVFRNVRVEDGPARGEGGGSEAGSRGVEGAARARAGGERGAVVKAEDGGAETSYEQHGDGPGSQELLAADYTVGSHRSRKKSRARHGRLDYLGAVCNACSKLPCTRRVPDRY